MNEQFGCEICWPASADEAWEARRKLSSEADLIDESHFHVMILKCPICSQQFVSVFTETVDWVDGEDPQYWVTLPLTSEEAGWLVHQGSGLAEDDLRRLGPVRKCLHRDYPKRGEPRAYWAVGISIRYHD